MPSLHAIDPLAGFAVLERLCARARRDDPFARAAGYFAMTGRKGLWIYGDGETAMIVCRHPNRSDRVLLFWPVGRDPGRLIATAMHDRRLPAGQRQLARVVDSNRGVAATFGVAGGIDQEDVLDWTYPVHEISTRAVVERKGGAFNNLRGHLNRATRAGLVARDLDLVADRELVERVVEQWAEAKERPGYSYDDLVGPTVACLDLAEAGIRVDGVVVLAGDTPVGFWIWQAIGESMAVSLVRVSIGRDGAAELAAAAAAERLVARGVEGLCLGGSETASLDAFKRKLGPVRSIELGSVRL